MKINIIILIGIIIVSLPCVVIPSPLTGDLEKAKLYMFDKNWDLALKELDAFIKGNPDNSNLTLALFYRGKCYEEKKDYKKAIDDYHQFNHLTGNANLKEEATVAIINLYFKLYQKGDKSYLQEAVPYLNHPEKTVRYFVAYKFSFIKDKKIARLAIPILQTMAASEDDEELQARARIALMKIDPDTLGKPRPKSKIQANSLKIEVTDTQTKKIIVSLSIPINLAKLAIEALPEETRKSLRVKGVDIDKLIESILEGGEIFQLQGEEENIKIWTGKDAKFKLQIEDEQ